MKPNQSEKERRRSRELPLWGVCQVNPTEFFWAYWAKGTDATSPSGTPTLHGMASTREESIRLAQSASGPTASMAASREAIRAYQRLNNLK
ncbi:MAG: hypothetical protein QM703_13775 [Gemmatales bacterium]